jgi:DNA (cytosine-5)-methyltransferase 1
LVRKLTAIDLFAGAGGFSLAAHQLGFDILAAVEFDNKAAETYRTNLVERLGAETHVFNQDINEVDIRGFMKYRNIKPGELDLLLGGPPCQGFSTHRIKDAGASDPRNKLLMRYFDFVRELRPKAFLVENVPGLLWKRHEDHLNKFMALAKKYNYKVIGNAPIVLNAKDYGVPQNRKRVFIFAIREDLTTQDFCYPPEATHFPPTQKKMPYWKTSSSIFEPIPRSVYEKYWQDYFKIKTTLSKQECFDLLDSLENGCFISDDDPCNIHMRPTPKMVQRFTDTPLNGSREDAGKIHELKCHSGNYKGHKDVYGRILIHLPSNTMTTGCNNPSKGRFVHPWLNHGITLRHAARLQSFPDDFVFLGTTTQQARQIGNAVPLSLGIALIKNIKNSLIQTQYFAQKVA